MNRVKKNKKKGFTLVELMIVVVIMVILAAAATPIFTGYLKKARAANHLADCRSIYTAVQTSIELQRSAAADMDAFKAADVNESEVKKEVESLTTYKVEPYGENWANSATYAYLIENDAAGERGVYCSKVYYNGGTDGIWTFDVEKGTFEEE